MFDLETAISTWRHVVATRRHLHGDDLDELECHLRDEVAHDVRDGVAPRVAFERALKRMGDVDAVQQEYGKVFWEKVARSNSWRAEAEHAAAMFRHHLHVAFRSLRRHKAYAASNLIGLAAAIASCLLIGLYISGEMGFDKFHEDEDRIYRLAMSAEGASWGAAYDGMAMTPAPWGPAAMQAFADVEEAVRFRYVADALFQRGDLTAYERNGFYADPGVFRVFTYVFLEGDPNTALASPNSVVLPRITKQRYFGKARALGETILVDGAEWTVTGVIEDVPKNTHFPFDFLVSMATYSGADLGDWRRMQTYTYLRLREGADPGGLTARFTSTLKAHTPEQIGSPYTAMLQPIGDIHLHSNLFRETGEGGSAQVLRGLALIAAFILIIACINYMNLATARSARRAKEIGIRKMSGAHRGSLIRQFIGESTLLSAAATVLGTVLAMALLPAFNYLSGKTFTVASFADPLLWLTLLVGALVVGLLAGAYPAFVLSGFRPIEVLKDDTSGRRRAFVRKGLVVLQFAISGFLIVATGVVYTQIQFVQTKDLGYQKDQIIVLPLNDDASRRDVERLRASIAQYTDVRSVSVSGNLPGGGDWGIPYVPEGVAAEDIPDMRVLVVDHDFIETYGMKLANGRAFSRRFASDSLAYLINQTAAARLGWSEPIGRQISMPAISRPEGPVIGVVEDFHFRSLHEPIAPIMFIVQPPSWMQMVSVKIRAGAAPQVIRSIEDSWKDFAPGIPFSFSFFDERFAEMYDADVRVGRLLTYFAILAILISSLGLLGLAAFTAEQRTKEIGIRKVLGASVGSIVALLSRDFLKLLLISLLIAVPLAYIASLRWLQGFAYHADLSPVIFAGGAAVLVAVALLTVGYQCLRAATADPSSSLRSG